MAMKKEITVKKHYLRSSKVKQYHVKSEEVQQNPVEQNPVEQDHVEQHHALQASRLLSLSLEVRTMIWSYVIPNSLEIKIDNLEECKVYGCSVLPKVSIFDPVMLVNHQLLLEVRGLVNAKKVIFTLSDTCSIMTLASETTPRQRKLLNGVQIHHESYSFPHEILTSLPQSTLNDIVATTAEADKVKLLTGRQRVTVVSREIIERTAEDGETEGVIYCSYSVENVRDTPLESLQSWISA